MPPVVPASRRSSAVPLVRDPVYRQLNDRLQALIRDGDFKPGQQFLTEREVSERYAVSRATANKALSHLVVEGVLEFRKGVGSFVREGVLDYDLQSLMSFTRKVELARKRAETQVLEFELQPAENAGPDVALSLSLSPSESVYSFERLRLMEGRPMILERRHMVAARCPGLTRTRLKGSLYSLLTRHYGLQITAADETIQAVSLEGPDARRLGVAPGSAALRVRAIGYSGSPLWLEETLYRGDAYAFRNLIETQGRPRPANLVICSPDTQGPIDRAESRTAARPS